MTTFAYIRVWSTAVALSSWTLPLVPAIPLGIYLSGVAAPVPAHLCVFALLLVAMLGYAALEHPVHDDKVVARFTADSSDPTDSDFRVYADSYVETVFRHVLAARSSNETGAAAAPKETSTAAALLEGPALPPVEAVSATAAAATTATSAAAAVAQPVEGGALAAAAVAPVEAVSAVPVLPVEGSAAAAAAAAPVLPVEGIIVAAAAPVLPVEGIIVAAAAPVDVGAPAPAEAGAAAAVARAKDAVRALIDGGDGDAAVGCTALAARTLVDYDWHACEAHRMHIQTKTALAATFTTADQAEFAAFAAPVPFEAGPDQHMGSLEYALETWALLAHNETVTRCRYATLVARWTARPPVWRADTAALLAAWRTQRDAARAREMEAYIAYEVLSVHPHLTPQ